MVAVVLAFVGVGTARALSIGFTFGDGTQGPATGSVAPAGGAAQLWSTWNNVNAYPMSNLTDQHDYGTWVPALLVDPFTPAHREGGYDIEIPGSPPAPAGTHGSAASTTYWGNGSNRGDHTITGDDTYALGVNSTFQTTTVSDGTTLGTAMSLRIQDPADANMRAGNASGGYGSGPLIGLGADTTAYDQMMVSWNGSGNDGTSADQVWTFYDIPVALLGGTYSVSIGQSGFTLPGSLSGLSATSFAMTMPHQASGSLWYIQFFGAPVQQNDPPLVPEPGTWLLLGGSLLGLCVGGFRRFRK